MSVKKNLLKNGIATALQKLVRVSEQLILVPFFISAWGAAYYGEWLTLTIIPSVLSFTDLGFGSAAANSFVLKYASGDRKGAADIEKSGFTIITLMVVIGTLVSFLAILVMAHFNIFEKSLIKTNDAIWGVSLLILARLTIFYQELFEAHFRAARRASLSINLLSINSGINLAAGATVLMCGYGIVTYSIVQLIVSLLCTTFYGYKANSILGLSKEFKGTIYKKDLKMITGKGFGYMMSPIWQATLFQGTTFAVRLALGAEAVAIFNTVRTLSRSINQMYGMVNATVFPELQFEIGSKNMEKAHKLFRVAILGVFCIAVFGALFLWLFGSWFYHIWTHNKLAAPSGMWNIFIVGILFNAIWWTAGMVFRAVNKPYNFALAGVFSALFAVISSYFLSKRFGLTGTAVGSLVFEVLMAIYVLPTSCKLVGMSVKDIFKNGRADISHLWNMAIRKLKLN